MNAKIYLTLNVFLMFYSTGGIFVKLAGRYPTFSLPFTIFYGAEILILFFYAIGWQQFIKRMPLSAAYANKAVTVIWGCIWGVIIFHERLSIGKVLGCLLVLIGVAMYGYADGKMSIRNQDMEVDV